MSDTATIMTKALQAQTAIPGFNIPYLPMMEPVVRALKDTDCFGLIMVARLEWEKFSSGSLEAIQAEYRRVGDPRVTRLHLDHVPVIDEDNQKVDFLQILSRAVSVGYESVMVDGSRLSLQDNISATRQVVEMAHASGVPVEAELGAVLGHEAGPLPPYEELFASGQGFTDISEAVQFVRETGVDWLSVAVGNIHGAISAARTEKKIAARLNTEHLRALREAVGIPLVLHGGTGIRKSYVLEAIRCGIAKINVATAIRQPYEALMASSIPAAQEAVYRTVCELVTDELELTGNASLVRPS